MMTWHHFGVSVRGRQHVTQRVSNQDAWAGSRTQGLAVVAVCDGLGSKRSSSFGSNAACRAVVHAGALWSRSPGAPIALLLRTIQAHWEILVHPVGIEDCGTTCLFALATANGRLVLAQIGDGLVARRSSKGELVLLEPPGDRFANETIALGPGAKLEHWRVHEELDPNAGTGILLATDGVADDLVRERVPELIEYLQSHYGAMPSRRRASSLAAALRGWPVPRHGDDKTIALLYC